MSGVFGVSRTVFDHPMFRSAREFSKLEAWLWLLAEAAWRPHKKRLGGKMIDVARGQVCASIRFMSEAWGWKPAKTQRFLDALKTDAMIDTAVVSGFGIITICKYNEYQKVALPTDTPKDTATDTPAIQQRYSSDTNYKETKEVKEEGSLRGPTALPAKTLEAEVYRFGKDVLGKSAGGVVTDLRKACDYDDAYVFDLLKQAAEKHDPVAWVRGAIKATKDRPYRNVAGTVAAEQIIESREDREWRKREAEIYRGVL